ncbi:MAG: hypothetical protein WAM14_09220, partial [Candidatus Nitrosopolaris sp.]
MIQVDSNIVGHHKRNGANTQFACPKERKLEDGSSARELGTQGVAEVTGLDKDLRLTVNETSYPELG